MLQVQGKNLDLLSNIERVSWCYFHIKLVVLKNHNFELMVIGPSGFTRWVL